MTAVARKPMSERGSGFRVKSLLRALGLPEKARWEAAHPVLLKRMVEARLREDMAEASLLSAAKTFLKNNLLKTCTCGAVMSGRRRWCHLCVPKKN
jgi:hypothetical protein